MKKIKQLFTVALALALAAVMLVGCIQLSDIELPSGKETDSSSHGTETFPHQSGSEESNTTTEPNQITTPQQSESVTTPSVSESESDSHSESDPPVTDTTDRTPETESDTSGGGEDSSESSSDVESTVPDSSTGESDENPPAVEKIKIYIDQGHNPHSYNTGAEGNGYKEQDITYTVGVLLAELLQQDSRFEVRLSRPTPETMLGADNQSSLQARCDEANGWEADYFISIHANSYTGTGTASGTEAFSFPTDVLASRLGEEILSSLNLQTGLRNRGLKDGSHLYVLKNTLMPAVLVELGFITHEDDALLMAESPELFATGLFNGIQAYFFPTEGES